MSWLRRLIGRVRSWYAGDMVPVDGWVGGIPHRPLVARAVDQCVSILKGYWLWLVSFALAVLGIVATVYVAK